MEVPMPTELSGRKPKDVVTFRCPSDLEEWLDARVNARANVKKTDAVVWALRLAHDFFEASRTIDARLKAYAKANDLTELGALKRVLIAGLDALEKKR